MRNEPLLNIIAALRLHRVPAVFLHYTTGKINFNAAGFSPKLSRRRAGMTLETLGSRLILITGGAVLIASGDVENIGWYFCLQIIFRWRFSKPARPVR